jgi:hypothetical protein
MAFKGCFMLRSLLILLILGCFSHNVFSQSPDPVTEKIKQARAVLIDLIIQGDRVMAEAHKDAMYREFRTAYFTPLYPVEYIVLSYWTNDLQDALAEIALVALPSEKHKAAIIFPDNQDIGRLVARRMEDEFRSVQLNIDLAPVSLVERDLLHLYLAFLFTGNPDREKLNVMADSFLKKHPGSQYESFVRGTVRYRIVEAPWSVGFSINGGSVFADGTFDDFAQFKTHVLASVFARTGDHLFQILLPTAMFKRKEDYYFGEEVWPAEVKGDLAGFGFAYERFIPIQKNWSATAGIGTVHFTYKPLVADHQDEFAYLKEKKKQLGFQPVVRASIGYTFKLGNIDPRTPWQTVTLPVHLRYFGTRIDGGEGIGAAYAHSVTVGLDFRVSFMRRQK